MFFDPLPILASARAGAADAVARGASAEAYEAGARIILGPLGLPVPEPVRDLEEARYLLEGLGHLIGTEQLERARRAAGDDPATLTDVVTLLKVGWRIGPEGGWTSPSAGVNAFLATAAFGLAIAEMTKPRNRRERRARGARERRR